MANLSCDKHVYNKTFSHKGISGGKMRVGSLVRIRQSFSQSKVGKLAIIVDKWNPWNVVINIVDTGQQFEFDVRKLEVLCK